MISPVGFFLFGVDFINPYFERSGNKTPFTLHARHLRFLHASVCCMILLIVPYEDNIASHRDHCE